MRKRIVWAFALLLIGTAHLAAQSVPAPGKPQSQPILLQGGTYHLGTGEVLENGSLLFEQGKITALGGSVAAPEGAKVVDCSGKHIYPGLIAPNTTVGLSEIEAVRATQDFQEPGDIKPHVRSLIGYNTDSRVTPTLRSNGVLMAQIAPRGGLITGTSSVVQLDAWNWEDAAYKADDALYIDWPSMRIWNAPWAPPAEEQRKRTEESLEGLKQAFEEARAYEKAQSTGRAVRHDLRWESMLPVIRGERRVFIVAHTEKEILSAVGFAQDQEIQMVLVGGEESYLVTDLLKSYDIPVVLQKPHSLPPRAEDDIDLMYRLPQILHREGIPFCLGMKDFWNLRNLPFQAGTAVAYGLPYEAAVASITLGTAKILGIDATTGSLEKGKDATLIVSTGDLLDMRSSNVEMAFIQGREVSLANKQKDLYEKFRKHLQED